MSVALPSPSVESIPRMVRPGDEKFRLPVLPTFKMADALLSAVSLLALTAASMRAMSGLVDQAWWVGLPFWFTAFGGAIGAFYEAILIAANRPYELFSTRGGFYLQRLRLANVAPVFGSVYLLFALLTYGATNLAGWFVLIAGGMAGFQFIVVMFRTPPWVGPLALSIGLIGQLVLVWTSPDLQGGALAKSLLTAGAAGLYATAVIGSETPKQSFYFHLVSALVVLVLYVAVEYEFSVAGPRAHRIKAIWPWLASGVPLGAWLALRLYPSAWAGLRSLLANMIWPLFYLIVAGGMRVSRPRRLSELYEKHEVVLKPLTLYPYYLAHPRSQTHPIAIPALDDALRVKVNAFGFFTNLVKFVFRVGSVLNSWFPFANVDVPLADKPRMEVWSAGVEYWPRWLLRQIFIPYPGLGWFQIESGVRGPGLQTTPAMAVEAYNQGQLLAYLVEYGAAGPFVKPYVENGKNALILDFSFLEKYETKPDYEPYGGAAIFEYDAASKHLRLTHVRAPRTTDWLAADPTNAIFRHAEDMVLASFYYYVVSGKHLVEIHMGLNLIEVALFNSFDASKQRFHPVRMALYPHLFAHELAEELTTQNLLEDKAVFSQIFATTNSALVRHINERFEEYELARDEDFEGRAGVLLTVTNNQPLDVALPECSLVWEVQYAQIWSDYAKRLIEAAYPDDASLEGDACVQAFYKHLVATFRREPPSRYDRFKTREGLARFVSDTMHHLIIRHEVYGTSSVRLAMDPRINKVQVPKDGGPYAVDEWRSLACIAMATSRVRYVKLVETDFSDLFDDLKDPQMRQAYKDAFRLLKQDLQNLQTVFEKAGDRNYDTLRLLPEELDIGAGY